MQERWIPIRYRCFYDIPRMIVVGRGDYIYLLNCPFDERADEYLDQYIVYRLRTMTSDHIDALNDWAGLLNVGEQIGAIATSQIEFDETKRRAIKDNGLELLA